MAVPGTEPQDFDVETALAATDRLPYTKDIGGGNFAPRQISPANWLSTAGTLDASEINNDSGVTGDNVDDALNTLDAASGVTTVFTRSGAVVATVGDYSISEVTNDSTVPGTNADDALDDLFDVGQIRGMVVTRTDTTEIGISAGRCIANGKRYVQAADTTLSVTPSASFSVRYIYIDDSASTPPAATYLFTGSAPTFEAARDGWYSGDDRLIGVVIDQTGASTIMPMEVLAVSDRHVRLNWGRGADTEFLLANTQNPDGAWQAPNLLESSVGLPVNATEIYLRLRGDDSGTLLALAASTNEYALLETSTVNGLIHFTAFSTLGASNWMTLGASRNIKIAGEANDDNTLQAVNMGCGYDR